MRTTTLPVIARTAQSGASEEKALDLGAHDCLIRQVSTHSKPATACTTLEQINT